MSRFKTVVSSKFDELWRYNIVVVCELCDKEGNRLGRGGGYYDRFLKKQSHATFIGVGYDFQLVDEVPVRKHDEKMHRIILPSQTIQV